MSLLSPTSRLGRINFRRPESDPARKELGHKSKRCRISRVLVPAHWPNGHFRWLWRPKIRPAAVRGAKVLLDIYQVTLKYGPYIPSGVSATTDPGRPTLYKPEHADPAR